MRLRKHYRIHLKGFPVSGSLEEHYNKYILIQPAKLYYNDVIIT